MDKKVVIALGVLGSIASVIGLVIALSGPTSSIDVNGNGNAVGSGNVVNN